MARRRTKTTVRLFEFGSSFFLPLSARHSAASNEMALRRFNAGGKKQKAQLMRFCKDIQIDLCGSIFDPLTVKWEFGSFVHVGVPYERFSHLVRPGRGIHILYSFIYMQIWNDLWFQHMWKSERSKECKAPYQNFMACLVQIYGSPVG